MAMVEVVIESEEWDALPEIETVIATAVNAALAGCGLITLPDAEVAVLLTDDEGIAALNARWRGKPTPTNVLSWPAVAPKLIALSPMIGDIALAYETCAREAGAEGKTFSDHIAHLCVHGTLHLAGHDHETASEAEAMEALERRILAGLGIADPYASPDIGEVTS